MVASIYTKATGGKHAPIRAASLAMPHGKQKVLCIAVFLSAKLARADGDAETLA